MQNFSEKYLKGRDHVEGVSGSLMVISNLKEAVR
jgi:hypothetical protein